jgi:3'-phosphoadenosine 5'-phosphosulfate sulfotransferase (PAPS reductase)/FAD synthetase
MSKVVDTLHALRELAAQHESVIVSYSAGKDSEVILHLARKTFRRVVALYLHFLPNLSRNADVRALAVERGADEVIEMMGWTTLEMMRNNIFCNYPSDELPDIKIPDLYALAMAQGKSRLILHGARKADSLWRRWWLRNIRRGTTWDNVQFPIVEWSKEDVLIYLKANGIPVPELSASMKGNATGYGLHPPTLLWIHDHRPDDFREIEKYFPFIGAVVARRDFYGIQ